MTLCLKYTTQPLRNKTEKVFVYPPELIITVQGGIGTAKEDQFLHEHYGVQSTGWGTPFLLVPEATTVDEHTLHLLCKAKKEDVVLSHNSPLGVRFHYLKGTTAEIEKNERILNGKPGSPCTEKHLAFNTEFTTEPICTASRKYQQLKIAQLEAMNLPEAEFKKQYISITAKECLCVGLSNAASITYNELFVKNLKAVDVCPGPNIAHFNKVVSLQTMTDHIYGRTNIMDDTARPNMFVAELSLYINFVKEQLEAEALTDLDAKRKKYYVEYFKNMFEGINYYKNLPQNVEPDYTSFIESLNLAEHALESMAMQYSIEMPERAMAEA